MKSNNGKLTFSKKAETRVDADSDEAYRDRAKLEQDRRQHATDSEFWICLCFKDSDGLDAFRNKTGFQGGRFVDGKTFRAITEILKPENPKRGFPRKARSMTKTPDPLKDVPVTSDLSADCIAEADALLKAFKEVRRPEPCREATDSDIWICVAFDDRDDVESYLTDWNIGRYGNKYLDASAWMGSLA